MEASLHKPFRANCHHDWLAPHRHNVRVTHDDGTEGRESSMRCRYCGTVRTTTLYERVGK